MDAKSGGRHHGTYIALTNSLDKQLLRSIKSYRRNIDEHHLKIANPEMFVDGWESRNENYKQGIIKKWTADIRRNQELLDVAIGVANERGLKYE